MILPRCVALLLVVGSAFAHRTAQAQGTQARSTEQPARFCEGAGVDDALRPVPASLVPTATRLFGLRAPASYVQRTTVFRCAHADVLICTTGADLPCGKANTSRTLPGASQYCREHAAASFIPMFVTGHDTIYRWHCDGAKAVAGDPVERIDARGFLARSWKQAE